MSISGAFIVPHPPIIMPQVGKGEEKKIQKTTDAYREAARMIRDLKPDTIILTSPHSVMYSDYFHISPGLSAKGDLAQFRAPHTSVSVQYDTEFVSALEKEAEKEGLRAGTQGEKDTALDHATVVPLSFINEQYTGYKLVRIGLSGLPVSDHYRLGMCIKKIAERSKKNIVFVASGDLSHRVTEEGPYGYAEEGPKFDQSVTDAMAKGDFLKFMTFDPNFTEKAAECGLRSFIIMAGALDGQDVDAHLLSYEGTFGVGYAVASFIPKGADTKREYLKVFLEKETAELKKLKENEDEYVRLARYAIEYYVRNHKTAKLPDILSDEMLVRKAGVFVSLKKNGVLRGCIGTISPVAPSIALEILNNAVSACAHDPRFDPVREDELDELVYDVDVLSDAEPIESQSMLDVKRYGVIVTSGYKRGLLLPDLDGVDSVTQQISIAMQKAGIKKGEPYKLERFEVTRHI